MSKAELGYFADTSAEFFTFPLCQDSSRIFRLLAAIKNS